MGVGSATRRADHRHRIGRRRPHAPNHSGTGGRSSTASERPPKRCTHRRRPGWWTGIPGVGWSTEHGDLRIPHFFGLHGIQVVPFLAWFVLLRRRRATALVFTGAASYLSLVLILMWQALRGESIIRPDAATLGLLGVWLIATVAASAIFQTFVSASQQAPRGYGL